MFSELQTSKTVPHFTAGYGLKDLSAQASLHNPMLHPKSTFWESKQTKKQKKQKLKTETVLRKMIEKELRTSEWRNCFFPEEI